jgi:hypothetical protein
MTKTTTKKQPSAQVEPAQKRSWPRPLLDRPSSHDALEILKRDPAADA